MIQTEDRVYVCINFFKFISKSAVDHLFKVTSSIDSLVLGDSQIIHQVKEGYALSMKLNASGKVLNQLFQKALHTGKRSKSETSLYEGAFSVSYAAVELANKIFGDLKGKSVLVIGAGETAELTLQTIIKKKAEKVYITNRTRENAVTLANKFTRIVRNPIEILDFDNFLSGLKNIDIVISSTGSPDYVITYDNLKPAIKQRNEPVLMIDIAIPRDIDPKVSKFSNIFLKNIDDLNEIVDSNHQKRMSIIPQINNIIEQQVSDFLVWYYTFPVLPAMERIRLSYNGQASGEIQKMRSFIISNVALEQPVEIVSQLKRHYDVMEKLNDINSKILECI